MRVLLDLFMQVNATLLSRILRGTGRNFGLRAALAPSLNLNFQSCQKTQEKTHRGAYSTGKEPKSTFKHSHFLGGVPDAMKTGDQSVSEAEQAKQKQLPRVLVGAFLGLGLQLS